MSDLSDIEYLNASVWATLRPSLIHGIGVFAIRDIPKGTSITDHSVHDVHRGVRQFVIRGSDFEQILPEIQALILDRTMFDTNELLRFYSPNFEATLQSFMNHSETPNTRDGMTISKVKKGEELTENFRDLLGFGEANPLSRKHYDFIKDL